LTISTTVRHALEHLKCRQKLEESATRQSDKTSALRLLEQLHDRLTDHAGAWDAMLGDFLRAKGVA